MKINFTTCSFSFRLLLLFLLMLFLPGLALAQKHTISGYVRDAESGENLIGVAIFNPRSSQGTTTNAFGFYSLTLPADSVQLVVSFVGYERQTYLVNLNRDLEVNFRLSANAELQAVEIVGEKYERITESTRMSTIEVPIQQIKTMPALFGEVDVLKTLQMLPGVQSGSEGTTGLYVRGGSPDQNLMLLDGTPVYNASHLFGFFSVFNADALNHVELIKGGFPARYGGRLSSVVDINMKEGNMSKLHGEGSVGLIASKITLEGPIKKDTSSFIISARRTYIDLLARPFMKQETGVIGYYFYDLNGKVNYKLSNKDRLYLSAYTGYDEFFFRVKDVYRDRSGENRMRAGLGWGNLTSALRWNRILTNKLFLNTHLTYTKYQFNIGVLQEDRFYRNDSISKFEMKYFSNIRDLSAKTDFEYIPSTSHYIRFGAQYIYHMFRPGAIQLKDPSGGSELQELLDRASPRLHSGEMALYVEDDFKLTERMKVNAGLRLTGYAVQNDFYQSLEPRLAARYMVNEKLSVKLSYARMTQYIHLLTNSGIGLPTDLWVPATARVKPQLANQVALGAARTFWNDEVEVSLEAYYKTMDRIIEYREAASFMAASDWENKVTAGKGWTYGSELFIQRKVGRTSGWLGYTLAWANRRFEELNFGKTFPYRYDRRHDLSLVVFHKIRENLMFSFNWVYGTGNAVTLSEARYQLQPYQTIEDYSTRNGYRMRAYHRLDLGLSKTRKTSWGELTTSLNIYNTYSRRNPYFIYFEQGFDGEPSSFKQVSLFPILPSLSFSFKF